MHIMKIFLLLMNNLSLWTLLSQKFPKRICKNMFSLLPSIMMFIGQLVTYFKGLKILLLLFKFKHTPKKIGLI